jgi:hypothetical protein
MSLTTRFYFFLVILLIFFAFDVGRKAVRLAFARSRKTRKNRQSKMRAKM